MLKFGGWTQLTSLSALVTRQTDAVVIGSFISTGPSACYDLGIQDRDQVRGRFPLRFSARCFRPRHAYMLRRPERIARTVLQGNRLLALISLGIAAVLRGDRAAADDGLAGTLISDVATIAVLLTLTFAVNNLDWGRTTDRRRDRPPRYASEYAIIGMVLNITATVVLGLIYGLTASSREPSSGSRPSSIYFIWRSTGCWNLPLGSTVRSWLWRLGTATGLAAAATYALRIALPDSSWTAGPAERLCSSCWHSVYGAPAAGGPAPRFVSSRSETSTPFSGSCRRGFRTSRGCRPSSSSSERALSAVPSSAPSGQPGTPAALDEPATPLTRAQLENPSGRGTALDVVRT